jgi:peptidoglycan/LPS O-acetylase OafA/YrhL
MESLLIYLDLIRIAAAIAVFCDHWSAEPFTGGRIWEALGFYGDLAVTIFFVLSGYVIAFVSATRENCARAYAVSRLSRLYSVAIVALLLTTVLDTVGARIDPGLYEVQKVLWKPESLAGYVSAFFFVNEFQIFQFGGIQPGTDGPFWSLSFEAAYYAIAGLLLFAPRRAGAIAALALLLMAGRTIAAMFPLWLLGFALFHWRRRLAPPSALAWVLFSISGLTLLWLPWALDFFPRKYFGLAFPWACGEFDRILAYDYAVALAFVSHLAAAMTLAKDVKFPATASRVIRKFSAMTFPLYLMHYPALAFFRAVRPWPAESTANAAFLMISTFVLVAALTPVCERLKLVLRTNLAQGFLRARRLTSTGRAIP